MRATSTGGKVAGLVLVAAVTGSVALPAAGVSSARLTKSEARTVTKQINLRQADFRGFKVHPYQSSKGARNMEQQYDACVGLAKPFVRKHSDAYDNGRGGIFSSVTEFVSSRDAARRDNRLAASQRARDCLKEQLNDIAKAVNAKDVKITVTPVTEAPVAGVEGIHTVKYTATFTVLGYHGTLHGWSIGFSRGNAEVTLNEIGTMDVPRANLNNALGTLVSRVKHQVPARGLPVNS